MRRHSASAHRSALFVAVLFVLGCAVGVRMPAIPAWPGMALGIAILLAGLRPAAARCGLPLWFLGALLLGGCWGAAGSAARSQATAAVLPGTGESRSMHVVGRVVRTPELDGRGGFRLLLDGRPRSSPRGPTLRFLLYVRGTDAPPRGGEEVSVWCRLRRPRGSGGADAEAALFGRGIDLVGGVKSARLIERIAEPAGPGRIVDRLRVQARATLDRRFGEGTETRAVLGALLLGDRDRLSPETWRRLRRAGLAHLVAISGLHVGMIALVAIGALRRGRLGNWAVVAAAVVLLGGFADLVGARPSVLRATLAAGACLFGRALGREGDPRTTLALLAALLAAANPAVVGDAGYRLSFAATAGILLGWRPIAAALPLPARGRAGIAVSLAAYAATAPLAAADFGRVAPVAVLANLVAIPLCACALAGGALCLLPESVPLSGAAEALARWSVALLLRAADWAGELPGGSYRVAAPAPWAVCACLAALFVAFRLATRKAATRPASALAWAMLAWIHLGPPPPAPVVAAEVLDVGQGLAVLLAGPRPGLVLVDAGGSRSSAWDPGERIVVPAVAARGGRLDVLILSHDHLDHVGGAGAVLREIEVGELWLAPGWHESERLSALAADARRRGTALVLASRGLRLRRAGLPLQVLGPPRGGASGGVNDRSLVVRVGEAPHRILLPGDVQRMGEERLPGHPGAVAAEALVLSHHGSRGSNGEAFLRAVAPRLAIVSSGFRNRFGHPHRETRERLRQRGIRLARTDLHGTITLRAGSDGWGIVAGAARSELDDADRQRHERQDEDGEQQDRHQLPARSEPLPLVEQPRVAVAHPQQDREPEQVDRKLTQRDGLVDDQSEQSDQRGQGESAVQPAGERIGSVAAVELADRKEVHRGHQHPDPARADPRIHGDRALDAQQAAEKVHHDGIVEDQNYPAAPGRRRERLGVQQAVDQHRDRNDEAGDRSGGGDVEQRPAMWDRPANPDDRTEGPEQERSRQEER